MRTPIVALALVVAGCVTHQVPRPERVPASVHNQLRQVAGQYPLRSISVTRGDSAVLTFEDPTFGVNGRDTTWMFGPPVKAEEAYGCPLPKVLGRKLARVFWNGFGKSEGVTRVTVRVRGTVGLGKFSYIDMMYELPDLTNPWAGDKK